MTKLTVIDVCRDLGRESPDKVATLAIGTLARDVYKDKFGLLPDKELRKKTNGGGSHCFAVYPQSFRPSIVEIIEEYYKMK